MQSTADVVIIGGGIIGASTLYHLANSNVGNTLLLEMDKLGSGITAHTAAWVMLNETSELMIRMSQLSLEEFYMFHEEFDIGLQQKGSLRVNTIDHTEYERGRVGLLESLGVSYEVLSAHDIKLVAPILNIEDIGIGVLCKDDGIVDAQALLHAYIKHARILGAQVEEGVKVINIAFQHDRVIGVETTRGFISTSLVVNAAGIYAKQIGSLIGLSLPIRTALRHNVFTESIPSVPEAMPLLEVANPEVIYIGSTGNRVDYTVGSFDTDSIEHKPNLKLLVETHQKDLLHRIPEVARAKIMNCTAGIRVLTPDGLPIVGLVESVPGYINNCGWAGHGVMHAPIAGRLIADCITRVSRLPIRIDEFLSKRFAV